MRPALEIAVQDLAGAACAMSGGADRIELGTGLALGGLTPSWGLIDATVALGIDVHVLVRPRDGGFDYSASEIEVIMADVHAALARGAAGVVIGGTRAGMVDRALVAQLRDRAGSAEVTFHRAFDTISDRGAALEQLIDLGVDRVLTSGGSDTAGDGLAELAALAAQARGRIQLMAGGGVNAGNVGSIAATGIDAVHSSAKAMIDDPLSVSLGVLAGAGHTQRATTDEAEVRALRAALDRLSEA